MSLTDSGILIRPSASSCVAPVSAAAQAQIGERQRGRPASNSRSWSTAPISRRRPIVLLSYIARAIASGSAPASVQRRQISNVRGVMCEKWKPPVSVRIVM